MYFLITTITKSQWKELSVNLNVTNLAILQDASEKLTERRNPDHLFLSLRDLQHNICTAKLCKPVSQFIKKLHFSLTLEFQTQLQNFPFLQNFQLSREFQRITVNGANMVIGLLKTELFRQEIAKNSGKIFAIV